jgi:hypothetical protein
VRDRRLRARVALAQAPAAAGQEAPPAPAASVTAPAPAPVVAAPAAPNPWPIRVSEHTFFKVGLQAQAWADFAQDSTMQADGSDGGYVRNLFFRRVRLIAAARSTRT